MKKLSDEQKEEIKIRSKFLDKMYDERKAIDASISVEKEAIRQLRRLCDHENSYCSSPALMGGPDGFTCRDCGLKFDR